MQFKKFSLSLSLMKFGNATETQRTKQRPTFALPTAEDGLPSSSDPYAIAGQEVLTGQVVPGLWAKATVEGNGTEGPTQAAYIRLRVAELEAESDERRRNAEELARQKSAAEAQRIQEIQAFAAEQEVTAEQAEEMLNHSIRKENGQFVLYLDEGRVRYAYDSLKYAIQYSKDWHRHRVRPSKPRADPLSARWYPGND